MRTMRPWLALAGVLSLASTAYAEVKGNMQAFLVTAADGKETFSPVATSKPGDVLEYRIRYENTDKTPVSQLKVLGPVPQGTEYLGNSARAASRASIEYSIDAGRSFSAQPLRTGKKGQLEPVPSVQFTTVRWNSLTPLQSGNPQEFVYRVRVKTGN